MSDQQKGNVVMALQILLGLVFLFSGFAKVIDPLGGWYKVDDYLTAFSWDGLKTLSFLGSVLLNIVEFALGTCLLLGVWPRMTSIGVLIFMVIYTPLTLYIAIYNPVTDCGCFGEALKISNWQTFWKNIVFSIMGVILYMWHEHSSRDKSILKFIVVSAYTGLFLVVVSYYCYYNLPIIDFRPYSIGTNIPASMEVPEGAPSDVYETYLTYEKNGEKKEFTLQDYPKNDSTWTFVDSRSELIEKGYEPPIHDFTMEDPDDGDLTEDVMANEGFSFIAVSSRIDKADMEQAHKINEVNEFCEANGLKLYMLTSTGIGSDELNAFIQETGAQYKFLNADEITLKTIVRSNPGLVLIKGGNVVNKWAVKNIPDFQKLLDEAGGDMEKVDEMQMHKPNNWATAFIFFAIYFAGLFAVWYAIKKFFLKEEK